LILVCNYYTANRIVSVSENKRTFKIINNSSHNINKVIVDGCYIATGSKCDFLFEIINNHSNIIDVFYVELKGSDIPHAIEQLENTINNCTHIHGRYNKSSYIVASKFPKSGTASQVLKKKFKKNNNMQLYINTKIKEVTI